MAIDLFCGLGGWTEGLLAEGYRVIGFDNERHAYGEHRYPAQLVIQDVLTLHGRQFKDAALIVASPPCQEFSYMAMPWSRAKEKAAALRDGRDDPKRLTALFDACFRIQREACDAAGHHIPLVVENVCGAQTWVGRARWHYGSFYLWGDVPALMPIVKVRAKVAGLANGHFPPGGLAQGAIEIANEGVKHGGDCFNDPSWPGKQGGQKTVGHLNKQNGNSHTRHLTNQAEHGIKQSGIGGLRKNGKGDGWFQDGAATFGSKSSARKQASAMIAKIPLVLSRHIGAAWYPAETS